MSNNISRIEEWMENLRFSRFSILYYLIVAVTANLIVGILALTAYFIYKLLQ
jgi:hypothetical protein